MILAKLFIPAGLLLTGWLLIHFLTRRNEQRVRAEWEELLRYAENERLERIRNEQRVHAEWEELLGYAENERLERIRNDCWGFWIVGHDVSSLSAGPARIQETEIPGIIRFAYTVLFDYLPVHCWVCNQLILEGNVKYRKDDVEHFLEESALPSSSPVVWLPRPYCAKCYVALGFEPYQGRKSSFTLKP